MAVPYVFVPTDVAARTVSTKYFALRERLIREGELEILTKCSMLAVHGNQS
jgi:hypothetical protein